ncbi:hypothetical protein A2U01_0053914 [Trifolium medium]|uniref:Uncharacterized protein n=1 Tax=Trifolium medium TaxID=97028 RepID=A0A392RA84_9FABA|nr:hypothetical protein [Trifolium medium]
MALGLFVMAAALRRRKKAKGDGGAIRWKPGDGVAAVRQFTTDPDSLLHPLSPSLSFSNPDLLDQSCGQNLSTSTPQILTQILS